MTEDNARSLGYALATSDIKEFTRAQKLKCKNWARELELTRKFHALLLREARTTLSAPTPPTTQTRSD